MGGYLKAFVLFFYLYKPFLERKYYIELINHLYNVEERKYKQNPGNENNLTTKEISSKGSKKDLPRRSRLLSWSALFKNMFKLGKK